MFFIQMDFDDSGDTFKTVIRVVKQPAGFFKDYQGFIFQKNRCVPLTQLLCYSKAGETWTGVSWEQEKCRQLQQLIKTNTHNFNELQQNQPY